MPRVGVSITKSVAFRGATQEFSNVYYYDVTATPSVASAEAMIDALVTGEKSIHATSVTFVRGRLWSQVGTPAQNEMIAQKNLSGTGARSQETSLDKERAFLFRIRAGVDSRGNPVYLRKWFHACGQFVSGQTLATGTLSNSSGFTQAERDAQVAQMTWVDNANGAGNGATLVAKSGRAPTAGATWQAHQFLEHHQLGDMWRAQ